MSNKAFSFVIAFALPLTAATVKVINGDEPGIGFNDATPASLVGGNTGTTLGKQRLNAAQFAADIWGATLSSNVTINILSGWDAIGSCAADGATLAGTYSSPAYDGFPGQPIRRVWYPKALANKLVGVDLDPEEWDIITVYNTRIGQTNCLTGAFWYYGLTATTPAGGINMVTVSLHEFAHGLGFSSYYNRTTGEPAGGRDDIYSHFLFDLTAGTNWINLTNNQRIASAVSVNKLVWSGPRVALDAASVLSPSPRLLISAPASIAGTYQVGTAAFGSSLALSGVSGEVMPVADPSSPGPACNPLPAPIAASIAGKVALIDRGGCDFTTKTRSAQAAGAVAVLIANNVASDVPPGLGGADPTITISAVSITLRDANILKSILAFRSRTHSGLLATLDLNPLQLAGADSLGRPLLYTPNVLSPGSSVSHWDTSLTPNQLMEPGISPDLTFRVTPPLDLTYSLLRDLGWGP